MGYDYERENRRRWEEDQDDYDRDRYGAGGREYGRREFPEPGRHYPYGPRGRGEQYPRPEGLRDYPGEGGDIRPHYGRSPYGVGAENYPRTGYRMGSPLVGYGFGRAWRSRGEQEHGRFRGHGPRNYRRSAERIAEDVNDRLTEHWDVDATDIVVEVQDNEVTLTGEVDSRYAKRLAEDIAEAVPGVHDVHNHLRVRREQERESDRAAGGSDTGEKRQAA